MAKIGRPKLKLDYSLIEKLALVHCTQEEIASVLDISVRTLQRDKEFCRIYKRGLDEGRRSLRRFQFASAANGNVTMQIWLGKQYLGQKDKIEDSSNIEEHLNKIVEAIQKNVNTADV